MKPCPPAPLRPHAIAKRKVARPEEPRGRCTNRVFREGRDVQCMGETNGSTQLCSRCKRLFLFVSGPYEAP